MIRLVGSENFAKYFFRWFIIAIDCMVSEIHISLLTCQFYGYDYQACRYKCVLENYFRLKKLLRGYIFQKLFLA